MLTRENKQQKMDSLAAALDGADALVIAANAGLTAADMDSLRGAMRTAGGKAQVVKNTLAKRVIDGGKFAAILPEISGALIYGCGEDAAAVAKVFVDAAKKNPKLVVCGGALANNAAQMDAAAVAALAALPAREQLLAQLLGAMQAPVAKLAQLLHEVPASLARALQAARRARADGGDAS